MGKIFSLLFGCGLVLWMGWVMMAADESTRVERAGSACGGAIKMVGSVVRAVDEDAGETIFAMHTSWSAACQDSIWFFFVGGEERGHSPATIISPSPNELSGENPGVSKKPSRLSGPSGDEQL